MNSSMDKVLNLREVKPISLNEMSKVSFPSEDVFARDEDKRTRITALDKAVTLCRSKMKTNVVFNTLEGFRSVEAPVLGINLSGAVIEGNHFIPMHAIYSTDIR
jgi:hypothetical protein